MNIPLVSIIITTKNEEKNLTHCLKSIKLQTYPQNKIEIIVVDNNSTDKTKKIAKQYTTKVYNYGPERSAQRNFGVNQASGKYILYLDADMILSANLIEKAVNKLILDDCVALYVPEIVLGNSFWSKVRRFERSFYDGTVVDAVRFISKTAFDQVGGFDVALNGPEDWDLDKRIRQTGKVDLLHKKSAFIYHNEINFNLHQYLNKKNYYAKNFTAYIKKWGKNNPDIKKQFSPWFRFFVIFLEKGKWKKLLKHPLIAIGMYFLKAAVGVNYLWKKN